MPCPGHEQDSWATQLGAGGRPLKETILDWNQFSWFEGALGAWGIA